ncbi:hypothetical protein [Pengzhenrongella frigida]|uniref:Uncharacterized protein n=1 Tax=Pengzhenrongella frigida TaxID=1259133 RepID=A0A4Q5N1C9_9MICO|nr:hypothetical protein [Cellulomonas sp. HLT2-17]RYV51908.1 hypothetical protein EUA98_05770 [Cellulomonas sp. HLT2-17]
MRLISSVLGFVLRKFGLFGALLLSLFLGYLLIQSFVPTLREAVAERDRLQQVAEERATLEEDLEQLRSTAAEGQSQAIASLEGKIDAEIEEGRRNVTEKKAEIERLGDKVCGPVPEFIGWVFRNDACKSAEMAVEKADEALHTLEQNVGQAGEDAAVLGDPALTKQQKLDRLNQGGDQSFVQREIDNKESELGQRKAEEKSLEEAQASGVGWVVNQWAQSWKWLAAIALLALVLPGALRIVSYFLLMPLVSRAHKPIHLAAGSENAAADLRFTAALRTLTIQLGAGEVLSARSEHVRPVQGKIRSRLLYDWTSPFISFAAGLYGLSRITGDEGGSSATLATPDDPNSYLMRIDFVDHPGLVMQPKHVVGVIGMPELETRWRWGIQSFATWQVRYIMFAGSGSLIVQGSGDVVATSPRGRSTRMEQNLVMGFDSRLTVGVNRTEVFWPYLWGRTPLVDDEFTGLDPFFWQKSSADGPSNPIAKTFDAIFSALGKLLGF